MTTIPEAISSFKTRLGAVNAEICAIDATLAEVLKQIATVPSPVHQIEQWALAQNYHLHFGAFPNLRGRLGTHGIVFQDQVLEGL